MRIYLIGILLVLITYSCTSKKSPEIRVFKTEFKKAVYSKDSFWLDVKMGYDSLNHLPSIENGVDSFVFRFWVDEQLMYGDHLFEIKFVNGKWTTCHFFYAENLNDATVRQSFSKWLNRPIIHDTLTINHLFEIKPQKFLLLLKKYKFQELPTQSSLKTYKGCCLDGVVYYYEFATKDSYKFCVYENPECCKTNDKEDSDFVAFVHEFKSLLKPCEFRWPMCKIDSSKNK